LGLPGAGGLWEAAPRVPRLVRHVQGVEDRRAEVLWPNRPVLHIRTDLVRLAVDRAAPDPAAGEDRGIALWPVLPAGRRAAVLVDPRGAAELADRHGQRPLPQPALVEVFEERGHGGVEHRLAPAHAVG